MKALGTTFPRRDLHDLQQVEIEVVARQLDLPHLVPFLASISRAQSSVPGGTVRKYL
jgi:hypothetical protein